MPWQVIDLEESPDKAIHEAVVALVMCLIDFLPQRARILTVAIHPDWQQSRAHCSSIFKWGCLDQLRAGLLLVSSACPVTLHNTIIISHMRCFNFLMILVPLVSTVPWWHNTECTVGSGHFLSSQEAEECLKQKAVFVPSVQLTANSGNHC